MTPVGAAAVRTALADTALNPDINASSQIVPITFKLDPSTTFTPRSLALALRDCLGSGYTQTVDAGSTQIARGSVKLSFLGTQQGADAGLPPSNYIVDPYFDLTS